MTQETDNAIQQAAKRILHHYLVRSTHIGDASEKMAVDYAMTLVELEDLERKLKKAASRGYLRAGL